MTDRNNRPLVSVIMPAYNAEKYIEEAIRSVISQTYENWELIVLDDGSKDGTADIIKKLAGEDSRIRFCPNEKNMGVALTRNRGFEIAQGDYVALLDSDDIWLPQKLEKQVEVAEKTGAEIVYCSYGMFDDDGIKKYKDFIVGDSTDFERMLTRCEFSCSTNLMTKNVYKKYKFSTNYYHEDLVLWLELMKNKHKAVGCTEVLAQYRQINKSRSANKLNAAKNRWIIYRKYLKLPLVKSIVAFVNYALAGVKKYYD